MTTQEQEARDYEAGCFDLFDGFDRGDTDFDYEAAQREQNEADEAEYQAALAKVQG